MVLIEPRLVKDASQLLAGGLAVADHAVPKMLPGALSEVASLKDAFQLLVPAASCQVKQLQGCVSVSCLRHFCCDTVSPSQQKQRTILQCMLLLDHVVSCNNRCLVSSVVSNYLGFFKGSNHVQPACWQLRMESARDFL